VVLTPAAVKAAPPPAAVKAAPPPVAKAAPPPAAAKPAPAPAPVPAESLVRQRFSSDVDHEEEIKRERARDAAPIAAIGRKPEQPPSRPIEDIIADLFDKTQEMYGLPNLAAVANFILDLAMQLVPADSGAVFVSDINKSDLFFAAARGPKAKEVLKFRVPMGQGIVGFSAQEGVSVAVSDVHKDPRFYAAISKALGYETRSILCAPAVKQGRSFGAVELINKNGGSTFAAHESELVSYLAMQFAEYLESTGQAGA
jgi:putative methionine-R-sulfoxide reductase with GAF domain